MKRNGIINTLLLVTAALAGSASAQITLTGTSYSQNFNSLSSGLPNGWSIRTNATATALGTEPVFTTNNTSWGSTSGQFANYASTISNAGTNFLGTESTGIQAACTNRCLGVRQTASFGDPGAAFVLRIQNTLGYANFQLTLDLNMLNVQVRSNLWLIDYGIGNSPLSFTPVWTNSDPGVFGATTLPVSFGAALNNQAQNVWIRIVTLETSSGSGSRDVFGIDNFQLNYQSNGAVSPIPLKIQVIGTNAVLNWTNSAFALQTASSTTGAYTTVSGATSPHTNALTGPQKFFRLIAN